ncbi:MAG: hypothetical protein EBR28_11615 [Planctomycetia bacterium]|nr:hypothetical protein [Planctomycetia bacterium]
MGNAVAADTVAIAQIRPVAAHRPTTSGSSRNSDQIQVARIAMSRTTAKASARMSPATLPRSQSHGRPGQTSVRGRRARMDGETRSGREGRGV